MLKNFKYEFEKIKNMNLKEKIWYIKEYYLIQIIIFLFIFLLIFSIGKNLLKKPNLLNSYFINTFISEETKEYIIEDFRKKNNLNKKNKLFNLNTSIQINLNEPLNSPLNRSYILKLTSFISSKNIDCILAEKGIIDYYLTIDAFFPLEEILPKDLLEKYKDNIYFANNKNGEKRAYAIKILNSNILNKIGLNTEIYFSIPKNAKNIKMALKFLEYIINF